MSRGEDDDHERALGQVRSTVVVIPGPPQRPLRGRLASTRARVIAGALVLTVASAAATAAALEITHQRDRRTSPAARARVTVQTGLPLEVLYGHPTRCLRISAPAGRLSPAWQSRIATDLAYALAWFGRSNPCERQYAVLEARISRQLRAMRAPSAPAAAPPRRRRGIDADDLDRPPRDAMHDER